MMAGAAFKSLRQNSIVRGLGQSNRVLNPSLTRALKVCTMAAHSSLAAMFMARVRATPDARAFQFPDGDGWTWLTWKQTAERVRAIAMGLKSLGVESEQRCSILATTRIDWVLADLGVMCAGGATTTIYPSNTADECAYIVRDSETRYIFAEDNEQVAKLVEKRAELGNVEKVITFDGDAGHDGWVITLSDLEELGYEFDAENATLFDDTLDTIKPEHLATLIYTSGTTGTPKGVELTHDCWVFGGEATEAINILRAEDHQYLWLPLSHSFGKVLEVLQLHIGFSTTIDGRVDKLVENLGIVRPTFMAAAPRIFEKVYNKVVSGVQMGSPIKQKIFGWSTGVGRQVSALRQRGKQPSGLLAIKYAIANKLVFNKLKNRFGGKIRFFVSGSAPLSQELAEFFHAADILILEGYGLTESSAASCINRLEQFAFGSVGPALPGVEIKLAEEDNEIWLKGRGIMRGYHNKPDDTAECLEDGWLKTGDIGELGEDGLLRVTDRKKDLIKTSGGTYVAPQALEGRLKSLCPYISQVLVHGDRRNFCSALISIDELSIEEWKVRNGLGTKSYEQMSKDEKVVGMVQAAVDKLNADLARFETIKKFALLPVDLAIETGELTPSMKVKRKVVEQKYRTVLDGFYEGAVASMQAS